MSGWYETPLGNTILANAAAEQAKQLEGKAQFDDVLRRLIALHRGTIGDVTPDNCMKSPTVNAVVTAISRRLSVSPVHVYKKSRRNNRDVKELQPDHPVAKLLRYPNSWQTRTEYFLDAASTLVRHGRYYAYKARGKTGPIRQLTPLHPNAVTITQDTKNYSVAFRVTTADGQKEVPQNKVHYVRGPARDYLCGDSPVKDVATAIGLEIAAEEFGASFFANGALPLLVLKYMQGSAGFKDAAAELQFKTDFQQMFSGSNRFKMLLLPKGIDQGESIPIENDKAQMLETRKYQRTVIAGAFGVPPHLVGDLERATFNNVEQQDTDFTSNVIQPVAQQFESAMERDLLTDEDYNNGIIIRFNLDSILRADFKSRQEGLRIQRDAGVISADEWRETEGKNPLANGKGGEDYMRPANMLVAGEEPKEPKKNNNAEAESTPRDQES